MRYQKSYRLGFLIVILTSVSMNISLLDISQAQLLAQTTPPPATGTAPPAQGGNPMVQITVPADQAGKYLNNKPSIEVLRCIPQAPSGHFVLFNSPQGLQYAYPNGGSDYKILSQNQFLELARDAGSPLTTDEINGKLTSETYQKFAKAWNLAATRNGDRGGPVSNLSHFTNAGEGNSLAAECIKFAANQYDDKIERIRDRLESLRFDSENHESAIKKCEREYNKLVSGTHGAGNVDDSTTAAFQDAADCIAYHKSELRKAEREIEKEDAERARYLDQERKLREAEGMLELADAFIDTQKNLMNLANDIANERKNAEDMKKQAKLDDINRQQDQLQQGMKQLDDVSRQLANQNVNPQNPNSQLPTTPSGSNSNLLDEAMGRPESRSYYSPNLGGSKKKIDALSTKDLEDKDLSKFKAPNPKIAGNPALGEKKGTGAATEPGVPTSLGGGGGGGAGGDSGLKPLPKPKTGRGPYMLQVPVLVETTPAPNVFKNSIPKDQVATANPTGEGLVPPGTPAPGANPSESPGEESEGYETSWSGLPYLIHLAGIHILRHRSELLQGLIEIPKNGPYNE